MNKILVYAAADGREVQAGLKAAHLDFRLASNQKGLERALRDSAPTVVLADVSMPQIDLALLLRRIRSTKSDAFVAIVDSSLPGDVGRIIQRLRHEAQPVAPDALKPVLEDLHDQKTGRLDAVRMAGWMGVSLARFAKFLGRSPQTVHKTPSGLGLQDRLATFARVAQSLSTLFGTQEKARVWLNSPNPELDGVTPMSLFERRKAEVVAALLEDALLGHPG